jgi:hypothetical protein
MNAQLETQKKTIAFALLIPNALLGLVALFFWNYVLMLILPLFGYALLWAYWLESRTTTAYSGARWASSIALNLIGSAIWGKMLNDSINYDSGSPSDDFFIVLIAMSWTVLVSATSLWGLITVVAMHRRSAAQLERTHDSGPS